MEVTFGSIISWLHLLGRCAHSFKIHVLNFIDSWNFSEWFFALLFLKCFFFFCDIFKQKSHLCYMWPVLHHWYFFFYNFQRVKVYRLNDDGKWDDQGTGHVSVDYMEVCWNPLRNLLVYDSVKELVKSICEINCWKFVFSVDYWSKDAIWLNANVILQRSEELGLFVIDEEDNETILLHRISPDDIYRKQEGMRMFWWIIFVSLFPIKVSNISKYMLTEFLIHFSLFSGLVWF